jgi:hypothetical protein
MPEPTSQPAIQTGPAPGERPLALVLVGLVNAIFGAPMLVALAVGAKLPPQLLTAPHWFLNFIKVDCALMVASSVGLWLMRRWGFGLMVLAYFSYLIALVVVRQSFICIAAMQFPLLALASMKWKALR